MFKPQKMRVAMAAWEIGRVKSGLGIKLGGLGAIIEELPAELVKAAARQDIELEIEILTPCFAHYDKSRLTPLAIELPAIINGSPFSFQAFEHIFPDGQKVIYFWDRWQLDWTNATAIYPSDPHMAAKLYSSVAQAMAGYIKQKQFSTVHLHDYHVGLIPFFLGYDCLKELPVHFTIHNATYQGITPLQDGGYASLDRLNLPGEKLFHKYFDFFNNLNLIKACMLKVYETGGKITTVSGDLNGTWGYAAELKLSHEAMWQKAAAQKGSSPGEVFVPNRHLDLFEKLPIAGITNGMSDLNRPEQLPELKASVLQKLQALRHPDDPIFHHPTTQSEMLARDHTFDQEHLEIKTELKRLLHLEAFGTEPINDPILITAIGRLVDQKNLGLVADIIERTIIHDPGAKFIILASAPKEDDAGQAIEGAFFRLAAMYPERVYFNNTFNLPLSKLILAGGDFMLIPSRFEPCGLVDYEASLVGNVVIGRATGGLTKVRYCAYLYEWLDISDRFGEAHAFFEQIRAAIDTYRYDPGRHEWLKRQAMAINASWDRSATQYIDMYRYGFLHKRWITYQHEVVNQFIGSLDDDRKLFNDFFAPGQKEYGDKLDWDLKLALSQVDE
ncbi:MAG: glycogen/starch synthase [Anaerolineales bacterium]|nr:glycogen/starch synthase [Anaerolineales bacterium]